MTERDQELSDLLVAKGLATRELLAIALRLARERRAAGEPVSLLQALISMGLLDLPTAEAVQAEAPPHEGEAEPLRAPSGRADQVVAPTPLIAPVSADAPAPDLSDPFQESSDALTALPDTPDLNDPFNESSGSLTALPPAPEPAEPEGAEEEEELEDEAEETSPLARLIPVLVGLILVGCVALVFLLRPPPTTKEASAPSPTPTPTGPPSTLPELELRLAPVVAKEDFAAAIALVEGLPGSVREAGGPNLVARLEGFRRCARWQAQLSALVAPKESSLALKRMVLAIENDPLAPELADLRATAAFQSAARAILGEGVYDDLVALGEVEEPDPASTPAPKPTATASLPDEPAPKRSAPDWMRPFGVGGSDRAIGSKERRARFKAEAEQAARRVSEAKAAILKERAATKARTEAELARAQKGERPVAVPAHRGLPSGTGKLIAYNERHFVLRMADGSVRTFSWVEAPASTACDLLERALDLTTARDQLRLGFRALKGSLFERARRAFAAAKAIDRTVVTPKLEPYRQLARVFHAPGAVTDAGVDLRYGFEVDAETGDFEAPFGTRLRLHEGALVVANWFSFGKQSVAFAAHRGRFAEALTLELERLPGKGRLLLGLSEGAHLVLGAEGVGIGSITLAPTLRLRGRVEPRQAIRLALLKVNELQTRLVVKQGERFLADELVTGVAWPFQFTLGVSDGDARLARLRLAGKPDREWLQQTRDEIPFRLEQALQGWEAEQRKGAAAKRPLPPGYGPTSAEDELCLRGIPADAQQLLARARVTIASEGIEAAGDLLRQALLRGRGRYWAVEYLLAQVEIAEASHASSLEGALFRLNRAIAGVEDFYEAIAARSGVHLRQGRLAEARADALKALALRADYAPARLALAYVSLQVGDLDQAVAEARLAARLSGRPEALVQFERLEALRDGPSWNARVVEKSERFRLQTDLLDRSELLLGVVEGARRDAPQVFTSLKARPGAVKRRADVFVFSNKEDYHRHAWRTGGDRKENAVGFFSPLSGQLLIYDSKREISGGMLRVLRHEATHQWVHSLGLALPYWVNEALADYMGGYDASTGKSTPDLPELKALIEHAQPPFDLYDLMTFSPAEFYSGNTFLKYAQAWSFVHFCMEGGDKKLKQTFFAYLAAHTQGDVTDKSRQIGVRLAHLYASTFHQLDMKQVAQRWWAYVLKMGRAAGLRPAPKSD